jgi:dTDP-glucose 4,6-dehydratase
MISKKTIFVTGGAGFIGSELIRHLLNTSSHKIVNIDKLTYSGNLQSLESIDSNNNYFFECIDICDDRGLKRVFDDKKT